MMSLRVLTVTTPPTGKPPKLSLAIDYLVCFTAAAVRAASVTATVFLPFRLPLLRTIDTYDHGRRGRGLGGASASCTLCSWIGTNDMRERLLARGNTRGAASGCICSACRDRFAFAMGLDSDSDWDECSILVHTCHERCLSDVG
ncbi:hypothetical protein C8Q70DRAFT_326304 [Cubamyces menziesii]|nr:hypothetical protein C8Q70DRAFT_326304 [Cubamyces menziesii]